MLNITEKTIAEVYLNEVRRAHGSARLQANMDSGAVTVEKEVDILGNMIVWRFLDGSELIKCEGEYSVINGGV